MVSILARLFIKNRENVTDPKVRYAYGTLCSLVGIFLNLVLFGFKYLAGTLSGSIAIIADSFNNLSDAGSSIITLLGFRLGARKPNPKHPYGHGRMEYISGLLISAIILLMGFELLKSSVEKIISPEPIQTGWLAAVILIASICVKVYMYFYNNAIGKKIDSAAMQATAKDSLSDTVSTLVVLLAMGVSAVFKINIDAYAGVLVALFVFYAGITSVRETLAPLLGQPPEPEFVDAISSLVLAHEEICGIHDLLVHDYGPGRQFISLHAEVDGKADVFLMHDAIDNIEQELYATLGCLATIHMDPIDTDSTEVAELRQVIGEMVQTLDPTITIHDLRVVPGPTHTNVVFDVVLPQAFRLSDEEARKAVARMVSERFPHHYAVINIDHSYV